MKGKLNLCLMALLLCGCENNPRTLAGGTTGALAGGVAGAGLSKMLGASNGMALSLGVLGAAVGGALGAKIGNNFDKEAKRKILEAAVNREPTEIVDKNGGEWLVAPSASRDALGRSTKVRITDTRTGKTIIIPTKDLLVVGA